MVSVASFFDLVEQDLNQLTENVKNLVGAKHQVLRLAAEYLFEAGGKRIRPALVLLMARATSPSGEPTEKHRRLAEITEMIHTASLVHDDVIDVSDVRRGAETVNSLFGNKVAVLAGDFLFAKSSIYLARLGSLEVVELLATVIDHLAEGEMLQIKNHFDSTLAFDEYIEKSFYKTASLMANSCRAAAVLSDMPEELCEAAYNYGRHLGIAFQVVDDLLDFTSSTETLGKPAASDLRQGHITAPVLYALQEFPELSILIQREFKEDGDIEQALSWVKKSQGLIRTKELAHQHIKQAILAVEKFPASPARQAMVDLTDYVLKRVF
jgi:all-trans-nonaprenyl-diphosphate synthase